MYSVLPTIIILVQSVSVFLGFPMYYIPKLKNFPAVKTMINALY